MKFFNKGERIQQGAFCCGSFERKPFKSGRLGEMACIGFALIRMNPTL